MAFLKSRFTIIAFALIWAAFTGQAQAQIDLKLKASHDVDNQEITYDFTVTNLGSTSISDVIIWDPKPNSRDSFQSSTPLISMSQTGFGPSFDPNDTAPAYTAMRETTLDLDLNGDGDKTDINEEGFNLDLTDVNGIEPNQQNYGVYAIDSELAAGASITMTYTIRYVTDTVDTYTATLTPESLLGNIGYATADLDNDPNTPDGMVLSNKAVINTANKSNLIISGDQSKQISSGGTTGMLHHVSNIGTGTAFIEFSTEDTASGWGHQIWINSGASITNMDYPPNDLSAAGFTLVYDETGTPTARTIEDYGIEVQGGDDLFFVLRTTAPYSAAPGQTNVVTVVLTDQGNVVASNENNFEVSETVIDFKKTVSLDANCSGNADANLGPDTAFNDQYAQAAPDTCVIWQIVATNFGTAPMQELRVIAIAPTFSTYVAGSIRACKGNAGLGLAEACSFSILTDLSDTDEAEEDSGSIMLNFGTGGGSILPTGVLQPGESVTVRYGTRVS